MQKIRSGVYGFDPLMAGGINAHTITALIGSAGAGKTTFAASFLKRGLEEGQDAIFITLDEEPTQIVKELEMMGWNNVQNYIDRGSMIFVDASGEQFSHFIKKGLPDFVDEWKGHNARIVIDPLTPVLWSVNNRYEQRELVSLLLRETRKIGTVICTLEEHGIMSDLSSPELVIPMYLADNVIHIRYMTHESPEQRDLKILKCRSSRHSHFWHPYRIVAGAGLIIEGKEFQSRAVERPYEFKKIFLQTIADLPEEEKRKFTGEVRVSLLNSVEIMSWEDLRGIDPSEVVRVMLAAYDIKVADSEAER